mgnify:CR=1 FL=1
MDTLKLVDFLKIIGGLKDVERFKGQYFWRDYPPLARHESVADHTWRMAVLLVLVEKSLLKPIDFPKAMKMLLVHDLAEIITGDFSPLGNDGTGKNSHLYNKEEAKKKHEAEEKAARQIFSNLPSDQSQELYDLWMEYEKQECIEAKVVRAIDKLEGKLQALEYANGKMFPQHKEFSLKYGSEAFEIDPVIKELAEIVNEGFRKTEDFIK